MLPATAWGTSSSSIPPDLEAEPPSADEVTRYDPPRLERYFDQTLRGGDLSDVTGAVEGLERKLERGFPLSDSETAFYRRALERVAERVRELRAAGASSAELDDLDVLHKRLGAFGEKLASTAEPASLPVGQDSAPPRSSGRSPTRFVDTKAGRSAAAGAATPLVQDGGVSASRTGNAMDGSISRAGLPDAGPLGPGSAPARAADPNAAPGALAQGGRQQVPSGLASDLAAMKNSPVNTLSAPAAAPTGALTDSWNALKGWLGEKWQNFQAPPPATPEAAAPTAGGAAPPAGDEKPMTREELLDRLSQARDLPPDVQAGLMDFAQRMMMHDTALMGVGDRLTRGRPDPRLQLEYFLLKGDVRSAALVYKALLAGSGQGQALAPDEEQALAMAPLAAERERRAPEVAEQEANRQVREERRALAAKLTALSAKLSRGLELPNDDDLALLRGLDPRRPGDAEEEGMLEDRYAGRVAEARTALSTADKAPSSAERRGVLGAFSYDQAAVAAWDRVVLGQRLSDAEEAAMHRAVTRSLMRKLEALREAGPSAELLYLSDDSQQAPARAHGPASRRANGPRIRPSNRRAWSRSRRLHRARERSACP